MGNIIASGAIIKPKVCVQFFNTDLTKPGVGLMEFKIRMGEVEEVLVTPNFDKSVYSLFSLAIAQSRWATKLHLEQ